MSSARNRPVAAPGAVADIVCNTRIMAFPMSGVQRVTGQILARLNDLVAQVAPRQALSGWRGHLWEQTVLPLHARGRLLWSPSATGPLSVSRQVITLHDVAFLDHPEFFSPTFAELYRRLVRPLSRRVRHIITVSEFSKGRIAERLGVPPEKVSVVPNGIAEAFCPQSPGACASVVRRLNLPSPRYVLAHATSDRRKNLHRIVEAWTAVAPKLEPDIWLVLAGNMGRAHIFGSHGSATDLGPRVAQLGFVAEEDLPPLMAGSIAFLYPSLYEGFGLPVLEAMAVGAPVVTSNATALPEVAADAAILVPPTVTGAIASAILQVVESAELRRHLQGAGFRRAQVFSWDRAARETLQILQEFVPQPT